MNDLLAAIQSKFTAAGLSSGIVGGLWFTNPPPVGAQVPRPYCVLTMPRGRETMWSFDQKSLEPYALQFAIFAYPSQTAGSLMESLIAVFDNVSLTLGGSSLCIQVRRKFPPVIMSDPTQRDESGNQVYLAVAQYEAIVQTT